MNTCSGWGYLLSLHGHTHTHAHTPHSGHTSSSSVALRTSSPSTSGDETTDHAAKCALASGIVRATSLGCRPGGTPTCGSQQWTGAGCGSREQ